MPACSGPLAAVRKAGGALTGDEAGGDRGVERAALPLLHRDAPRHGGQLAATVRVAPIEGAALVAAGARGAPHPEVALRVRDARRPALHGARKDASVLHPGLLCIALLLQALSSKITA